MRGSRADIIKEAESKGIRVKGFIVAEKKETEVAGLHVYSAHEIPCGELTVVATRERFHQEIFTEIQCCDIKHVVCISDGLFENIKNRIKWPRKKLHLNP